MLGLYHAGSQAQGLMQVPYQLSYTPSPSFCFSCETFLEHMGVHLPEPVTPRLPRLVLQA